MSKLFVFASACLAPFTLAQTEEQKEKYSLFHDQVAAYGYQWEPHEIKTEDGWLLTIFRITGRNGERPALSEENRNKMPLLMQHGYGDSALGWVSGGTFTHALPLKLVDAGYDVWMGNNRGVPYSNEHDRDGEWSIEERWDFTWAEMGIYDMPSQIEKVLEITQKPKVTVMGYSQGSAQNLYGMAKKPDFFAETVNRFIAVAPCVQPSPSSHAPYPSLAFTYKDLYDEGVYFKSSEAGFFGSPAPPLRDCSKDKSKDCEYEAGYPVKSAAYFSQITTENRFQEPISIEKWLSGNRLAPLVDLGAIDRVPVSFVVAVNDHLCPPELHEYFYQSIKSEDKFIRYERGGHLIFYLKADDPFVRRMIQTIETGTVEPDDGGKKSSFPELILTHLVQKLLV